MPIFSGCRQAAEPNQVALPPATVRVQAVERQAYAATEEVIGTVRPKLSTVIEAKVSGRIAEMLVVPGQTVTSGERLVRLDAHEIQSRLDQATAARQQAENDLKRATELLQQKIMSPAEFDSAQSKFRVALAAEAEAKTMQDYAEIMAPFAGVITRKLADVGDLAMPGKPLLHMENPATLRFEADVPEALIDNVKLADKLFVRVTGSAAEIAGVVAEMSPAADANSRTYLVKLDLPGATGLRSGQFGHVTVPVGESQGIRVPATAVLRRGELEMVFVVVNGHAWMRLIKSGRLVGGAMEVVSGLDSGETIVSSGVSTLADGQPVVIQP